MVRQAHHDRFVLSLSKGNPLRLLHFALNLAWFRAPFAITNGDVNLFNSFTIILFAKEETQKWMCLPR
jgi:hypothetical protein